jgi:hypothetical protein
MLIETERNIQAKLGREALLRFYQELASLDLELIRAPTAEEISTYCQIINPNTTLLIKVPERVSSEVEDTACCTMPSCLPS